MRPDYNVCTIIFSTFFSFIYCRPKPNSDSVQVLPLDKLQPPDHLEGVRFEQDGMLNKDFHKESFLGHHEEIDDEPEKIADSKLKEIFYKVDTDKDGQMNLAEMETWILAKVQQHFDEAKEENAHIFEHMDPDKDGLVDWKEYYRHFLLAKKYDVGEIDDFMKDYGENSIELKEKDRDQLVRYKFKWTDVEGMPVDNKLNKEEFLAFRHPESSALALNKMVETILNSLDGNNDGNLTVEEFVALPPGDVEDPEQLKMDKKWQEERRREFKYTIDRNRDGIATRKEVEAYVDPRNPDQIRAEAANLLEMLDDDKDSKVSLKEMFLHKDVFIDSKVVNVKRSLHDEF